MRRLDFNGLVDALRSLRGRTVVTGHSLEDVDALSSSAVLAAILGADVRVIDRENAQAKAVGEKLGLHVEPFGGDLSNLNRWDNLVFVDVSSSAMLGVLADALPSFHGKVIAVDHHAHGNPLNCDYYCDESKSSCSEIIADVAVALGRRLNGRQASLLALGVLSDSARLKSASSGTVISLAGLLAQSPADFADLQSVLDVHHTPFERIEAIQSVQSASIERKGDAVAAFCAVKSHEHNAAEALVSLGADIAVALNGANGKISVIKGGNPAVAAVHCGELARAVAGEFGGSGGGHEMVAGLAVPKEKAFAAAETTLRKAKQLIPS
ncbi:MAG: DHH family phosphoesterase, partial [Candidatus Micrarchaeota archaeon]